MDGVVALVNAIAGGGCLLYYYYVTAIKGKRGNTATSAVTHSGTAAKVVDAPETKLLISGPIMYAMYKLGDRTFLLFGDDHDSLKGSCEATHVTLRDWLHNVLKNNAASSDPIDFFLETDGRNIENVSEKVTMLKQVNATFKECITADKSKCKETYPNGRVHYVDIRSKDGMEVSKLSNDIDIVQAEGLGLEKHAKEGKFSNEQFETQCAKLLDRYPSMDDWLDRLKPSKKDKVRKQLDAVPEADVKASLERLYIDKQVECKADFDRVVEGESICQKAGRMYQALLSLTSVEMDMYTLGRIFKRNSTGGLSTRIIIYAGYNHIKNYMYFIDTLLKGTLLASEDVKDETDKMYRCVSLSLPVLEAFPF